jgi:hypothetical protein
LPAAVGDFGRIEAVDEVLVVDNNSVDRTVLLHWCTGVGQVACHRRAAHAVPTLPLGVRDEEREYAV